MADFSVCSTDFWRTIDTTYTFRALWNSIDNVSSDSEHVDKRQYHNVLFVFDTIPFNMHQRSSFDCGMYYSDYRWIVLTRYPSK